ncbi:iron transporter [Amycolatopsis sp. MJM2582]|uniref:Conserved putative membrane protein n=1 Tax=Amycolatopsis japonica TaxID=208439 RepID=A0A075UUB5_9PSEU|nr:MULTISPECIES: iron uptake transporter permease EfeU [Amycolatopsis]AIG73755.1 Conserved putative membrane protein [Amycolatopsis japonica]KFZ79639.1 iron transporter [Amycolatopsis sp. MJM2582]OKJ97438.1 iron transporter [Amycolatopsis sp. CB00013]RSN47922.1 iron transporter [Amycolatopsis sp. WAC 04197]
MWFASALIGLREGLEAALVVSILVAFLVKTERRHALRWVWLGVGVAVALSVGVGAILTYSTAQLTFEQQELLGGTLSIVAVGFVTAMIFWMRKASRTIAAELRGKLDEALDVGPVAVLVLSFFAVGREGLETAVFFYSTVQTAQGGTTEPLIGFSAGILVAVVLAYLIYRGAVRFDLGKFFTITGVLLVFVAAGVLGYGLHDLQEAAFLPGLTTLAFDASAVLPEDSWYGALLKGIFNYSQQTTVLQAVAWVAYVAIVLPLFLRPKKKATAPAAAAIKE